MSDNETIAALAETVKSLQDKVTRLEDIHAVRTLHFKYGYFIDQCYYDEAVDLFARDSATYFLNGIFRGPEGARRLYCGWFREMFTQGVNGPIYGFLLDHVMTQDIVDIEPDGKTAHLRGRCVMQAGYHETKDMPVPGLPDQCWEGGIHQNTYVKEDGVWKIKELNYNMLWQADYDKGWAHSAVHLPPLEKNHPEDPNGPDELMADVPPTWPKTRTVPYHYTHPVTGKAIPYNKA